MNILNFSCLFNYNTNLITMWIEQFSYTLMLGSGVKKAMTVFMVSGEIHSNKNINRLLCSFWSIILSHLFVRSSNYGDRTVDSIADIMKSKNLLYIEAGGLVEIEENPLCICIVTPLMKRAHGLSFSKDVVFVDSSSSRDQSGPCVTFFGSSKVGGIPLTVT